VVAPYNVVPEVGNDIACVIVEPVAANMGLVEPAPGFLEGLRSACDRAGALLIFDEVITGFRVARGGATELYGVQPDLWCFGKIIGGGLPVGAFGGRRDVMEDLAPVGPVYQAGTLSGNPLATAAGLTVLELLDDDVYATVFKRAEALAGGLAKVIADAGIAAQVPVVRSLVGIFFGDEPVTDYDGSKVSADTGEYARLFGGLLERGVAMAPGPYEVLFPSAAHSESDIEKTVEAVREAITA
jgi:glutamate-1-semialdehyde 2,1-aminomutase